MIQASWHGSSGQDWLEIDLLKEYRVVKVVFYNRRDCCNSRADNALLTLMDASRNTVNTAVLNSDLKQTFNFAEVETCLIAPNVWRSSEVLHAAVFISDSVLAVLTKAGEAPDIGCSSHLYFMHVTLSTSMWRVCVNIQLTEESQLLFDRGQQIFSLIHGDSIHKFDANGNIIYSHYPEIGHFLFNNAADTLETDLAVIVAREQFYSHCNLFTGVCVDLISRLGCGHPVFAIAHGLHAVLKCSSSDEIIFNVIAGCEAGAKPSFRLSGCAQMQSHLVSTMVLSEASNAEARWLWAVSFRLQELFRVFFEVRFQVPASSPHHSTICTQIFSVLTYISAALNSGWLLHPLTRSHLEFLGYQHSIFDTISCIASSGTVNQTAVSETLANLQRLHPWFHITVSC
jgi:hypothetical protein